MATVPVIEAADVTSTAQVDATVWPVNVPNCSTGDGLIFCIIWDDSANVTSVTAPTGPNGESITAVRGIQASNNTEMRMQVFETICTGSWTAGTVDFTPSAQEQAHAHVIRVAAGEFDAANFIGASGGASSASTAETDVLSPAFSANSDDTDGRLVILKGADGSGDITPPASGFTTLASTSPTVASLLISRDTGVSSAESIPAYTSTLAVADSWATIAFIVRANPDTSEATATPGKATLTVSGRQPATSAFNAVRIREVLVNGSGQTVGNATDITLLVWYSGACRGAPDLSINGMTTDANGTTSWSIATGSLALGGTIFYVAQNSVSLSHYTAARMVPAYE